MLPVTTVCNFSVGKDANTVVLVLYLAVSNIHRVSCWFRLVCLTNAKPHPRHSSSRISIFDLQQQSIKQIHPADSTSLHRCSGAPPVPGLPPLALRHGAIRCSITLPVGACRCHLGAIRCPFSSLCSPLAAPSTPGPAAASAQRWAPIEGLCRG